MKKIYVIVGSTASGKSNLAVQVAKSVNGEIVNADSIQVYKDNNVNWFGCILLVLVTHILFIIPAIDYWFYKLCTVGRK